MDTCWPDVPDAPATCSGGAPRIRSATTPRTTNPSAPFTTRTTGRSPAETTGRSASGAALPSSCPATVRRSLACGSRADLQIPQQSPRSGPGAGAAEVEQGPGPVALALGAGPLGAPPDGVESPAAADPAATAARRERPGRLAGGARSVPSEPGGPGRVASYAAGVSDRRRSIPGIPHRAARRLAFAGAE